MISPSDGEQRPEAAPRLPDMSGRELCVRVRGNGPTVVLTAGIRPPNLPAAQRAHRDASHRRLAALAPRVRWW